MATPALDIGQHFFRLGPMAVEVEGYIGAVFSQMPGSGLANASRRPSNQRPHGPDYGRGAIGLSFDPRSV